MLTNFVLFGVGIDVILICESPVCDKLRLDYKMRWALIYSHFKF